MINKFFDVPILIIIYNRTAHLPNLFNVLKKIKPKSLYIAAEGPVSNDDLVACTEVRENLNTLITWKCNIKYKYRNSNAGLKVNINEALDWLFLNEHFGIILEDDCDPSISFFQFCEELLKKYQSTEKIKMISGNFYYEKEMSNNKSDFSYFFSQRPGTHGWATWKRAWLQNDKEMKDWNKFFDFIWLLKYFKFNLTKAHYFYKKFQLSYSGSINSWDYQWLYSIFKNNGLVIKPFRHLCKHVGWGDDATHSKREDTFPDLFKQDISFPIVHPAKIKINHYLDDIEDVDVRKIEFINYFYYKIKNNSFIKKIKLLIR